MTGQREPSALERTDTLQRSILQTLLLAHPAQRSVEEVLREITDRPDEFSARDAITNALRDLVGAGLVHRHGAFVFATWAAVRFHELAI
jgi:Fe2+ or Zn2+ uptake regulation protein